MTETEAAVSIIRIYCFEFVSDFVLSISDLSFLLQPQIGRWDFPQNFFSAGYALRHFEQRGAAEFHHAVLDRLGLQLFAAAAGGDHGPHRLIEGHDLEHAAAAGVTLPVALVAA